jgi:hypothetical protein
MWKEDPKKSKEENIQSFLEYFDHKYKGHELKEDPFGCEILKFEKDDEKHEKKTDFYDREVRLIYNYIKDQIEEEQVIEIKPEEEKHQLYIQYLKIKLNKLYIQYLKIKLNKLYKKEGLDIEHWPDDLLLICAIDKIKSRKFNWKKNADEYFKNCFKV